MIDFGAELRAAIDNVDPRLHQFLGDVVNSFIRLEMVVLIRRSPESEFVPSAISGELGWPEDRVCAELAYLEKSGILKRCSGEEARYCLSDDPQVSDLLNKFGFLYANRSSRLLILGHLLREGVRTRD